MIQYLIRRLISGLIVLFIFVSTLFFAVQVILPGDYVSQFALGLTISESEEFRQQLGLDKPIFQRYLTWLNQLAHGNLGETYNFGSSGTPISSILSSALPPSILVFGIGTVIAFLLGQWLGKVTAWRGPGFLSSSATFGAISLYTSFPPWLAFLAVYFFVTKLNIITPGFTTSLWKEAPFSSSDIIVDMLMSFTAISLIMFLFNLMYRWLTRKPFPAPINLVLLIGEWVASLYATGISVYALDILKAAALPLIVYVLLSFGEIMLIMRTTMVDSMQEDFVNTARAKGLPDRQVRDRHAARNALLPVLSGLVIRLPYLLTGSVMIEYSLNWEGVGTRLFYAVGRQDISLMMGLALTFGMISLVARLILDIIQAYLDPRIRYSKTLTRSFL
jgi:peptide/nickel transport system permease protein